MFDNTALIIELPEEFAADAVQNGIARRVVRRRGAIDVIAFVLGLGGSLISVVQTPTALRDFSAWLAGAVGKRRENIVVRLARTSDGGFIMEVGPDADPEAVAALLKSALDARDS